MAGPTVPAPQHAGAARGQRLAAAALLGVGALLWHGPGAAQSVSLSGVLGPKALLVIDGRAPKLLAPGETHHGVKLLSVSGDQSTVEIAGKSQLLRVGESPVSVGGRMGVTPAGARIVLIAGNGGHFMTMGQINGRPVQMMVDTGATSVGISVRDAERMGLDYKGGQPLAMSTANGPVRGWRISLASVRMNSVEVNNVDAVVTSGEMPYVLLGNSFLMRFQMARTNDQLVLERRY